MKLDISIAILIASGLSACAAGYSSTHMNGHDAEEPSHVVKMATTSASEQVVLIPPETKQPAQIEIIIEANEEVLAQPIGASVNIDAVGVFEPVKQAGMTYTPAPTQTYKKLEYGAHKALVCKDPVLAKGKLKKRPNLQVMWENYLYPRPEGIWSEIGGYVEINGNLPLNQGRWTNACAIRVSHMLLKAGHRIPQRYGITSSAANKDQYIYRLSDMEDYLVEILGKPDFKITDGTARWWDLPHTPGIVLIDFPGHNSFTGHTTVWNGAGTVDGSDITGDRVLFWELPCFIPEDRIEEDEPQDEPEVLVGELDASLIALP